MFSLSEPSQMIGKNVYIYIGRDPSAIKEQCFHSLSLLKWLEKKCKYILDLTHLPWETDILKD